MASDKEYVNSVLLRLGEFETITTKPMFGEYCIYYNEKPVGFICDNRLLIKQTKESEALKGNCEEQSAYPGSKLYFYIDEEMQKEPQKYIQIMRQIAENTPAKKPRKKK